MKKRILSFLIILCLFMTIFSCICFADDAEDIYSISGDDAGTYKLYSLFGGYGPVC